MAVERQVVLGGGKRPSAVVDVLAEGTDLRDYLLAKSASLYDRWMKALPRIRVHYAVKANSDSVLLQLMTLLGAGFDCASKSEIAAVLSVGASPDQVLYANAIKAPSHLRYATERGVRAMTFDCESELLKIREHAPDARLLVRIVSDNTESLMSFEEKFGCSVSEAETLMLKAKQLGLSVVGVSFHIGTGSHNPEAYRSALSLAAAVFWSAEALGCPLSLLDIGGGFLGMDSQAELFEEAAAAIHAGLEEHFADFPNVEVIAEPGRFFASPPFTMATSVIGKKKLPGGSHPGSFAYYLSDKIAGQMFTMRRLTCCGSEHLNPAPELLTRRLTQGEHHPSVFWGPTCSFCDKLCEGVLSPELEVGDWVCVREVGAYLEIYTGAFNGFQVPTLHYCIMSGAFGELQRRLGDQTQTQTPFRPEQTL